MINQKVSDNYVHLILDGSLIKTRVFDSKKRCFLAAYGITPNGKKELIDVMMPSHENERDWTLFLTDLKKAGLTGNNLETITSDDHFGIGAAVLKIYPGVFHSVDTQTDFSNFKSKLDIFSKVYSIYNPKKLRLVAGWFCGGLFLYLSRVSPQSMFIGGFLAAFGEWIRIWSAGTLVKTKELTVSGPYAYTRNPLYIGSFFISLGLVFLSQAYWMLPLVTLLFYWVYRGTVQHEEDNLSYHFGESFKTYTENVPRLFPRLTPFKDPKFASHAFSMAHSHKNGELMTLSCLIWVGMLLTLKEQWLHQSLFQQGSAPYIAGLALAWAGFILFQYSTRTKQN